MDPLLGRGLNEEPSEKEKAAAEKQKERFAKLLTKAVCQQVAVNMILPWLVFVFAVLAFMHAHHPDRYVRAVAVCGIAGVFLLGFFLKRQVGPGWYLLLLLCGISVLLGAVAGSLCYCSGAIDYWAYEEHWQYTNVWPTELASAHRDASAFVFAQGAAPDTTKGTGLTVGTHTYCVAPITMGITNSGVPDVQYWAAGRDCCPKDGSFICDDAGVEDARAGLVMYNRTFEFYSAFLPREIDYYNEAARRAILKYSIVSTAEEPVFVRWVRDLDERRGDFWHRSMVLALEMIVGYLPISCLLGLLSLGGLMKG